jgi:hypothetical protein
VILGYIPCVVEANPVNPGFVVRIVLGAGDDGFKCVLALDVLQHIVDTNPKSILAAQVLIPLGLQDHSGNQSDFGSAPQFVEMGNWHTTG